MTTTSHKKKFFAIKRTNQDGFFAGYDVEGVEIFRERRYWLYDFDVAKKAYMNMRGYPELEIVESPVQDEKAAWGEESGWRR